MTGNWFTYKEQKIFITSAAFKIGEKFIGKSICFNTW